MTLKTANQKFKSEVVKYACEIYQMASEGPAKEALKKALNNVNRVGAESLRDLAMDAAGL